MTMPRHERTSGSATSMIDGDLVFQDVDFRRIARIAHGEVGIYLADNKASLVYSRLAKRLRRLGLHSFRDYCDLVSSEKGRDERRQMLSALTTNVTSFFREPHHFEMLEKTVLPPLLQSAARGGRVRIWSAGCSRGLEPYSAAMTILSLMPNAPAHDIKILATDIDTDVLRDASTGCFDETTVAAVPPALRRQHFETGATPEDQPFCVTPAVRGLVTFRELNLMGNWPMKHRFDVIFCRNTVIYFDNITQDRMWQRFSEVLKPGGYLFIGHSERVSGPAEILFQSVGLTTYRRTGEA